ncbi:hypothetical protein SO802_024248 [Lithocarpus litseifolius]|uniref:Uncharacterized protein n=1 Tax=Lithocarpus litseifolius TaxID=425828 RepID=A0AAW2CDS2_9ROSI
MEMEIEMEMRAREDIEIREDITPLIPPLSYALHCSFLHSHCYSCFSPLPLPLNSNYNNTKNHHHYYYCSPACTTTRVVSTEELYILQSHHHHPFSSDLRAALRFLQSHPNDRIAGLLTNCRKLLLLQKDDEFAATTTILEGAKAIATATATDTASASAALCLVLTNGVEVQDNDGHNLGIAVTHKTSHGSITAALPMLLTAFSSLHRHPVAPTPPSFGFFPNILS